MSSLFITLYLDEDVDVLVAGLLRARGFDVVTTVEAGQRGRSDEEQLVFAVASGRAFLTHNRADFARLAQTYADSGKIHCGIFIVVRHPAREIVRRLLRILDQMTGNEMQNQTLYL